MKLKTKKNNSKLSFNIIGYIVIVFVALISILPFWLLISGSFTSEFEIATKGFSLLPEKISFEAYEFLFRDPMKIFNAYKVSIITTVVGTLLGTYLTALAGYVISRKTFMLADKLSFFLYFTTLFNGGLLPYYILLVRFFHVKDTYLALLIPGMLSVFNIIVMKSFIKGIPWEIYESGKVDGAKEFAIFNKLYLPMMKPCLATIALFTALTYWNNWSNAMLYINNEELYPLQYLLYRMTATMSEQVSAGMSSVGADLNLPTQSVKLAMTVVAIGPIVLVYPFVQRFFVGGITIGAVKG